MSLHESFNATGFSRFINSSAGIAFRLVAGTAFLVVGYLERAHPWGIVSMIWSAVPLSAGGFDLCYVSGLLGGPFSGARIRSGAK